MDDNRNEPSSNIENNNNDASNNPDKNSNNNTNRVIMIVVMVGILLCILLVGKEQTPGALPAVPPTVMAPGQGQPVVPTVVSTNVSATVVPGTVPATLPSVPASPIQGINWQWTSVTDQSTSQTTTVPTPQQYTLAFNTDGTVNGIADCNSFTGTYSQANGLSIKITTMTMAACPEGSLEQQFIQLLDSVAAGGPDGSANLALETAGGAQRMLFQNGGPAR
jgi:heat shock protein HslJ